MLGNHKGFCRLFNDCNINSNLLQRRIVDTETHAELHKVGASRVGEEPLKSHAKSLVNEDLEERNQVITEEIREWRGASESKLNEKMLYVKLSFRNIFIKTFMLVLQKSKSM